MKTGNEPRRGPESPRDPEATYRSKLLSLRTSFAGRLRDGEVFAAGRADAADGLVADLVSGLIADVGSQAAGVDSRLRENLTVVAVGGYGRRQLFPFSDLDVLFLLDGKLAERDAKDVIRQLNQRLWDAGIRVAPATRRVSECERWDPHNAEFTLSLLDCRHVAGAAAGFTRLVEQVIPALIHRDRLAIRQRLLEMTRSRHARYGGTLFHLEPNLKDCPGGLRDVQVAAWLDRLEETPVTTETGPELRDAVSFLATVRCFLHLRQERDDNVLDWAAQDAAADNGLAMSRPDSVDAAYWMRVYFRHAREIERAVERHLQPARTVGRDAAGARGLRSLFRRRDTEPAAEELSFYVSSGQMELAQGSAGEDPAHDPHVMLRLFEEVAGTGARLSPAAAGRLGLALPLLSAHLEEGPEVWQHLQRILTGSHAGSALRAMHALGLLELLIPEFHGIDALVIRDAYHRYTVDEHTFVVIDTLHRLESGAGSSPGEWSERFGRMLRDLPHRSLLYMAALLHDTGKGRNTGEHAGESARMAAAVLDRMGVDLPEAHRVTDLIAAHLEMSAALRRDIFDAETVRGFASRLKNSEALRMLTLFTYADIEAVHPDALTQWKAENLWRLYIAAANVLDRSVDEERVGALAASALADRVYAGLAGSERASVERFLEGFPERYVRTRPPEQIRAHVGMAEAAGEHGLELDFRYTAAMSELTLVTHDRPHFFADVAGALAGWGMNIVTADAFSNRRGLVVDSFRFTDPFRTLELNETERDRFAGSLREMLTGAVPVERLLNGRRRAARGSSKLNLVPSISFDLTASSHSTLMEVVASDTPGLLRSVALTLAELECNIELALVDTEGETAIDVFYLTRSGGKLDPELRERLRSALLEAIEAHAQ